MLNGWPLGGFPCFPYPLFSVMREHDSCSVPIGPLHGSSLLLFAEARGMRGSRECGDTRGESKSITLLADRRCGSFEEGRQRLRSRGGDHRTGASEKSERMRETEETAG